MVSGARGGADLIGEEVLGGRASGHRATVALPVGHRHGQHVGVGVEDGGGGEGHVGGQGGVGAEGVIAVGPAYEVVAVCGGGHQGAGAAALRGGRGALAGGGGMRVALDVGVGDMHHAPAALPVGHVGGDLIAVDAEHRRSGGVAGDGEGQRRLGGEHHRGVGDEVAAVGGGGQVVPVLVLPAGHVMQLGGRGVDGDHLAGDDVVGAVFEGFHAVGAAGEGHATPVGLVLGEGECAGGEDVEHVGDRVLLVVVVAVEDGPDGGGAGGHECDDAFTVDGGCGGVGADVPDGTQRVGVVERGERRQALEPYVAGHGVLHRGLGLRLPPGQLGQRVVVHSQLHVARGHLERPLVALASGGGHIDLRPCARRHH